MKLQDEKNKDKTQCEQLSDEAKVRRSESAEQVIFISIKFVLFFALLPCFLCKLQNIAAVSGAYAREDVIFVAGKYI